MNKKKADNNPVEGIVDGTDFVELKRDMQSAKVIAWLEYNQQQLIAGAIVFVLVLVGVSLWKEQKVAKQNAAALLYMKAVNTTDAEQKKALFENVLSDYADSGYATLARLQQLKDDDVATKKEALQALIDTKGAPEFVWQAKLDLAELLIAEGDEMGAEAILEDRFGASYEQARYALLAELATDTEEKATLIQKALDAESNDNDLVASLEAELALLRVEQ